MDEARHEEAADSRRRGEPDGGTAGGNRRPGNGALVPRPLPPNSRLFTTAQKRGRDKHGPSFREETPQDGHTAKKKQRGRRRAFAAPKNGAPAKGFQGEKASDHIFTEFHVAGRVWLFCQRTKMMRSSFAEVAKPSDIAPNAHYRTDAHFCRLLKGMDFAEDDWRESLLSQ